MPVLSTENDKNIGNVDFLNLDPHHNHEMCQMFSWQ